MRSQRPVALDALASARGGRDAACVETSELRTHEQRVLTAPNLLAAVPIKVLIARMEPLLTEGALAILKSHAQFEITTMADDLASTFPRMLSECDVVLAGYDAGLELARQSRGRAKILVLTDVSSEGHIRRGLQHGLRGYLTIGCGTRELVDAVARVARGEIVLSDTVVSRLAESLTSDELTPRELDVLAFLAAGWANKAIANHCSISTGTVKSHVKSIVAKLRARGRTEAAAIALRRGLVDVSIRNPSVRIHPT